MSLAGLHGVPGMGCACQERSTFGLAGLGATQQDQIDLSNFRGWNEAAKTNYSRGDVAMGDRFLGWAQGVYDKSPYVQAMSPGDLDYTKQVRAQVVTGTAVVGADNQDALSAFRAGDANTAAARVNSRPDWVLEVPGLGPVWSEGSGQAFKEGLKEGASNLANLRFFGGTPFEFKVDTSWIKWALLGLGAVVAAPYVVPPLVETVVGTARAVRS